MKLYNVKSCGLLRFYYNSLSMLRPGMSRDAHCRDATVRACVRACVCVCTNASGEDVDGVDGGLAGLLVAEDQVDPGGQVLGHVRRLQRLAVQQREQARVRRPARQLHVVHARAALPHAQLQPYTDRRTPPSD